MILAIYFNLYVLDNQVFEKQALLEMHNYTNVPLFLYTPQFLLYFPMPNENGCLTSLLFSCITDSNQAPFFIKLTLEVGRL